MGDIRDNYNQYKEWLKEQDQEKINFLVNQDTGWNNSKSRELGAFKETYYWIQNIDQYKEPYGGRGQVKWGDLTGYITGEKVATLEDISKHMLKSMAYYQKDIDKSRKEWIKEYGSIKSCDEYGMSHDESWTQDEHDSGYAGIEEYEEIIAFWTNLSHQDVLDAVSGDVDMFGGLDGHRHYWFTQSSVYPLIFSYLQNNKVSKDDLENDLYNSNDAHDDIIDFYPPEDFFLPTKEQVDQLYIQFSDEDMKKKREQFNMHLERIVKQFDGNPDFRDKVNKAKELMFEE